MTRANPVPRIFVRCHALPRRLSLILCSLLAASGLGCRTEAVHARRAEDPAFARRASYPAAYAGEADHEARLLAERIEGMKKQIEDLRALEREYRANAAKALRDPMLSQEQKDSRSAFYTDMANRMRQRVATLRRSIGMLQSTMRDYQARASEDRLRAGVLRSGGVPEGANRRP